MLNCLAALWGQQVVCHCKIPDGFARRQLYLMSKIFMFLSKMMRHIYTENYAEIAALLKINISFYVAAGREQAAMLKRHG